MNISDFAHQNHNHIIEFAAASIVITSLVVLYFMVKWTAQYSKTDQLFVFIESLGFIIMSFGLYVGWDMVSRASNSDRSLFNEWMWEHTWLMSLTSAAMFMYGCIRFINIPEQMAKRQWFFLSAIICLIALFISIAW